MKDFGALVKNNSGSGINKPGFPGLIHIFLKDDFSLWGKLSDGTIVPITSGGAGKMWVGLIDQAAAAAPVVSVLTNQISKTIAWVRDSAGHYTGTFSSPFADINKVFVSPGGVNLNSDPPSIIDFSIRTVNTILILNMGLNAALMDGIVSKTFMIIDFN